MNFGPLSSWCKQDLPFVIGRLRQAVEIESPSGSAASINRAADFFARELSRAGGEIKILRNDKAGNAIQAEFFRKRRSKPILALGHMDTVWEIGTLKEMPFGIRGGRAYGPGVLDMKAGLLMGIEAVRCLNALGVSPGRPFRFLLTPDEETGSHAFRSRIEVEAQRACACLVLEPAARGGKLKTARKGVGEFQITVHGRPAHAGINPSEGVNAILELATQLLMVQKLAGPRRGLTLNIGRIFGGTRTNVVPEWASASIDVRVPRARDAEEVTRRLLSIKPLRGGAKINVTGGINRPPMERRITTELFRRARELGRTLGLELEEASTGGGSDGNFTASLGVPTLDGLGAVGDGAHGRHEHVLIRELPRRTALLAALLATL
jgi:glutamate carboxypeptidase